jgi:NADP-reducing hydrogenase subunit HndD
MAISESVSNVEPHTIPFVVDGQERVAPAGSTILQGLKCNGIETPTLCYLETLTPVSVCRVCVVELEGNRTLVPACSRALEPGMRIYTDSPRVRTARKLVLELLVSAVDMTLVNEDTHAWMRFYDVDAHRFDRGSDPAEIAQQPVIEDNPLFVRDYSKCILCYKCVEACGTDAQNTFAISVAGRGFEAGISTEFSVSLDESACVFCGNCIAVCPTAALMPVAEYRLRKQSNWRPEDQTVTRTVCPFCGVGCNLELTVQDNRIVKATSPQDHSITNGNLCIKGRFGWEFINQRGDEEIRDGAE